ncbi:hypothetical protein [Actinoplanes sp. NPDC051851]|uniref:hypothetical protein n=1 Tax=Actinoplanes sp. NPDC051851 TaxID=3154753 RepID=UPI00342718BC
MTDPEHREPDTPEWLLWPIRVLALIIVLPVRFVWELLDRCVTAVYRHVLVPLGRATGWLLRTLLVVPALWLARQVLRWLIFPVWRVLRWIGGKLWWVVRGILGGVIALLALVGVGLWSYLLHPLYRWVLRPIGVALAVVLRAVRVRVVAAIRVVYRRVLVPIGQGIAWAWWFSYRRILTPIGHGLRWVGRLTYRRVLRPAGLAIAGSARVTGIALRWTWRHTLGPVFEAVGAAGRWVRAEVLRPAGRTVRAALGLPPSS